MGDKIKILHITTDSKIGGTEKMLVSLAEHFDRNRFEMVFATLIGKGGLLDELSKRNCRVYGLQMRNKLDMIKILKLYSIIKKEKPDIVNTYLYHGDQAGRILAKLAGVKKIVSSYRSPDYWKKKRHIILDSYTARFADAFTSNSEIVKNVVSEREKIDKNKIKVIPNGIKLENDKIDFKEKKNEAVALKKNFSIPEENLIAGIVANLTPVKNYKLFIDICAGLNRNFHNISFVSIGSGPELKNIEKYASEKKVGNIRFLGHIPGVRNVLRMFDVFVLTSLWESSSRAVLEAMAEGVPVVIPDVGGLTELVSDFESGFLCGVSNDCGNPQDEYIEKISMLINDAELRKKFSENALEKVKENFTIEKFIKSVSEFYESVYRKN